MGLNSIRQAEEGKWGRGQSSLREGVQVIYTDTLVFEMLQLQTLIKATAIEIKDEVKNGSTTELRNCSAVLSLGYI